MALTISGLGYLIAAICAGFFAFRLAVSYKREKNSLSLYYSRAFFFMALMLVSYAFPTFFWPDDSLRLGMGELVGNIFLVLGFAYFIMVPLHIQDGADSARKGYYVVLIWGVAILFLTFTNFPHLFIDKSGILTKVYSPSLKLGYYLFIAIITFIVAVTFFNQARKSEGYSRKRSLLLGFAFFFGGVGGGFIKVVENTTLLAWSFASLIIGFFLVFLAALYRKKMKEVGEAPHNTIIE